MSHRVVYVALQQFCETDDRPKRLLLEAGWDVRLNTMGRRLLREEMPAVLRDADAVLAGVEPYDAEVLAALPRLRCISRCGAGTDSVDLEAARRLGITVYTTAEEVVEPVAQMTVGMILALARNLPLHLDDVRKGLWKKRTGILLSEWTIGVVGFGRIGRRVEQCLRGFGPRVLVHDPRFTPSDLPDGVALRSLPVLLAEADLVSIHASRRQEEGALIGRQELAMMKPRSYLVSSARGFLVDEAALYDALCTGHLAGAAIDVFQVEPYTGPLARLPNVLCTPHVASLTTASRSAMERRCAESAVRHFTTERRPTATGVAGSSSAPALVRVMAGADRTDAGPRS
ncbi:MAG: phosphoglycerate dehydrogenase [Candidatus Omnitrophica bacterium]|nr:phosphoglycerate dehydrogenase [Candidatus Omnitrophota bacterium]